MDLTLLKRQAASLVKTLPTEFSYLGEDVDAAGAKYNGVRSALTSERKADLYGVHSGITVSVQVPAEDVPTAGFTSGHFIKMNDTTFLIAGGEYDAARVFYRIDLVDQYA